MEPTIYDIYNELKAVRIDIEFIKNYIEEFDALTSEDINDLQEAEREYREGKTKKL